VPKQSIAFISSRCPSAGAPDAFLRAVLSFLFFLCLLGPSAAAQDPASDTLKHYLAALVGSIGGHVSLDGRYIAFVDWSTGNIAVHEIETGEYRLLTHKGSWLDSDEYAQGRWLAFIEWDMEDGGVSLKLMPAEGGEVQSPLALSQVRILRRPLIELTWTSDSRHIVYAVSPTSQPWSPGQEIHQLPWETGGEYGFEFWQIPVEGGRPQLLGASMETLIPYGLSIAPDGRRLVFTAGPLSHVYDPVWALENFLPALEPQD
jgi:Tol biopolymer transport system component